MTQEIIKAKWQHLRTSNIEKKLRNIKFLLNDWLSSYRNSCREEVVLTRLRMGQTYSTHHYLMTWTDKPICKYYSTDLTLEHILADCSQIIKLKTYLMA